MPYKKKSRLILHVSLLALSVCLLVGLGGLSWVWNYLVEYEKSNPQHAVREILTLYQAGDYAGAMARAGVKESGFFTASEYEAYVKKALGDLDEVKIYETQAEGKKAYRLKGSSGSGIRFVLDEMSGKLKYGLPLYQAKEDTVATQSWQIYAPPHVKVNVNGTELTQEYRAQNAKGCSAFDGLKDAGLAPVQSVYKITGLINPPEISLSGIPKEEYHMQASDGTISITLYPSDVKRVLYEEIALETAKTYAKFVSRDAKFAELKKYLYPETKFYDSIRNYSNYWYIEHDSISFENVKVQNTVEYSETHFSTEVSFDFVVNKSATEKMRAFSRTYPTGYRLSFLKIENGWQAANIEIL